MDPDDASGRLLTACLTGSVCTPRSVSVVETGGSLFTMKLIVVSLILAALAVLAVAAKVTLRDDPVPECDPCPWVQKARSSVA